MEPHAINTHRYVASGHVRDFTVFASAQIAKRCNRRLQRGADPGDQEVEPGANSIAAAGRSEQKLLRVEPACTSPV